MSRAQYEFDVWSYIAKMGIRMRPVSDNFYLEGDAVCAMRTCQYVTQEDCEEFLHVDYKNFCCSAPGCQVANSSFKSLKFVETINEFNLSIPSNYQNFDIFEVQCSRSCLSSSNQRTLYPWNAYRRERIRTIDLHVPSNSDQLL